MSVAKTGVPGFDSLLIFFPFQLHAWLSGMKDYYYSALIQFGCYQQGYNNYVCVL